MNIVKSVIFGIVGVLVATFWMTFGLAWYGDVGAIALAAVALAAALGFFYRAGRSRIGSLTFARSASKQRLQSDQARSW